MIGNAPMKLLVSAEVDAYVHAHTKPRAPLYDELREATYASMRSPQMQVGRVEGTFLALLVGLSRARRIVEVGTFSGYSALCMAEALPEDGELVTCDIDPVAMALAKTFFAKAPWGSRIVPRLGDALETIRAMPTEPHLDLVFLDADKPRYLAYYEELLPRLRPGGLVVADNTLWSGEVVAPHSEDGKALDAYNARITADPRVDNVLLSVRDGVMLARKR